MKNIRKVLVVLLAFITLGLVSCGTVDYSKVQKKFEKKEYFWNEVELTEKQKNNGYVNVAYAFTGTNEDQAMLVKSIALGKAIEAGEYIVVINVTEEKLNAIKDASAATPSESEETEEDPSKETFEDALGYIGSGTLENEIISALTSDELTYISGNMIVFGGASAISTFESIK